MDDTQTPAEKVLERKLRGIRLLALDVDGVLTDGRFLLDGNGREIKPFCSRDGQGLRLLLDAGLSAAIISGRGSLPTARRARELGIADVCTGVTNKAAALANLLDRHGLRAEQAAFVGDDVEDIPALRMAGFSVLVADSPIRDALAVDYITRAPGGRGAVREVTDLILRAQGLWDGLLRRYLERTAEN